MAKILKVRFTVVEGTLPNGLALNPDTGILTGAVGFDSLGQGPAWQTPTKGSLGTFNEGDVVAPVNLVTSTDKTPVHFSLPTSNDKLPWGITLDPINGVIAGTIAPLKLREKEKGVTSDGPTWNTSFGRLAAYDEDFSASIGLSATPLGARTIARYSVIEGYLPWGLKLNFLTGAITGTVGRLKNPGAYVDVPKLPIPTWTTGATLGTVNEFQSTSFQLTATPADGRSIAKYLVKGGYLPWGLKLNYQTGAITGTTGEIYRVGSSTDVYYDATKDPVFSNDVVINTVTTSLPSGGSIGSYAKGAAVSATFTATPTSGRTIRNYTMNGFLPFGLKLNGTTGVLSGTIVNTARVQSKTYNFTISATDTGGTNFLVNQISRAFSITVQ